MNLEFENDPQEQHRMVSHGHENYHQNDFSVAPFDNSEINNPNPMAETAARRGDTFDHGNHLNQRPTQRRRRHHSMKHWSASSDAGHHAVEAMGVKRDREWEGRCANCGVQTHQVVWASPPNLTNHCSSSLTAPSMLQKIPLTIENEVHRGRCLFCFPVRQSVEWNHSHSNNMQAQQQAPYSQRRNSLPHMMRRPSHVSTSSSTSPFQTSATSLSSFGEYSVDGDYMLGDMETHPMNHNNTNVNSSQLYATASDSFTSGMSDVSVARSGDNWHRPIMNESTYLEETLASLKDESADLCHVISTMRRFPTEARIQEMGCEKLWIQSWDDDNSMAIGRMGGIPTILDAMRTAHTDPGGHHGSNNVRQSKQYQHLHQCGCEALQNLAFVNDYNRDVIIEKGGVPVIIDIMQRHGNVPDIQFSACTALTNLVSGSIHSEDHKRAIIDAGGVTAIAKVAHMFSQRANPSFFGKAAVRVAANQALEILGYNHRDDDVADNLGHENDDASIIPDRNWIAVIPPDDDDSDL
eukprot:CAMPEP_0198297294 /NCGR_PEP_ID=MMETSP1449-20131203/36364_1 /TAXON_ID=420275 /ORGANISM="Attheya septentrionalis, Strain CCMP2084" /LENGTH=522 /DNA_ID=CAMNT_0043998183 /DNA_START=294 /DNA_END=1862 /DNA_ORIENTATION=-